MICSSRRRISPPAPGRAIVFIGLSSGGGYVLWLWALKTIAATRVTVFLALSPITATALGVALLGEPVTAGMMAGVVVRGGGVVGGELGNPVAGVFPERPSAGFAALDPGYIERHEPRTTIAC